MADEQHNKFKTFYDYEEHIDKVIDEYKNSI